MNFILSSQNVLNYLSERKICNLEKQKLDKIEARSSKNFNLLVSFADGSRLLVKQERRDRQGRTRNEFADEWRIQELCQKHSQLSSIRPLLSEAIDFDAENSIIVFKYLDEYTDLGDFYAKANNYPTAIAFSFGASLATIHRATIDSQQYRNFLISDGEESPSDRIPNFLRGLERLTPEIFGSVISDGIQFFRLYQLYDSLGQAIAELNAAFVPCCLTHNDLKLDNVLLYDKWESADSSVGSFGIVRLIDWELSDWGDPAYDLGIAISSYIRIWLRSLVVSADIALETSLQLATTPLEQLQPSIAALIRGYCSQFPEIIARRPDFLPRVMQFTGLGTIRRIQANLQYKESFDNTSICMLQVAKTLLCRPETSISTICGVEASELLTDYFPSAFNSYAIT